MENVPALRKIQPPTRHDFLLYYTTQFILEHYYHAIELQAWAQPLTEMRLLQKYATAYTRDRSFRRGKATNTFCRTRKSHRIVVSLSGLSATLLSMSLFTPICARAQRKHVIVVVPSATGLQPVAYVAVYSRYDHCKHQSRTCALTSRYRILSWECQITISVLRETG